jgi:hypothetical protein
VLFSLGPEITTAQNAEIDEIDGNAEIDEILENAQKQGP